MNTKIKMLQPLRNKIEYWGAHYQNIIITSGKIIGWSLALSSIALINTHPQTALALLILLISIVITGLLFILLMAITTDFPKEGGKK